MKTSRLLTKKQIAHSRYTRISNLLFIIPYHVTGSSPNASLWVYSKFFNTFPCVTRDSPPVTADSRGRRGLYSFKGKRMCTRWAHPPERVLIIIICVTSAPVGGSWWSGRRPLLVPSTVLVLDRCSMFLLPTCRVLQRKP